jgi:DNA-directed RNA polymerase subunit M/transcription elongation factor TFIIS
MILEFCDKCGSMMLPSTDEEDNNLICNLCKNKKVISNEIRDSYIFHKEIHYQEE